MTDLQIHEVQNKDDLEAFIAFPWQVYAGDPYWVPPLIGERKEFLDPDESPFFQHGSGRYFIARRGDMNVGTIAAFTNDRYNEFHDHNKGWFGFFEVLDDPHAAALLLDTAMDWAKDAGHKSIVGPAQFSTNDELGLLVDGFDDSPRILMTYNPPRYASYFASAGFDKAMDLWAYAVRVEGYLDRIPAKLVRVTEKIRARRKWVVRRIDMHRFDEEVEFVKHIYNRSWERNWGFVPFTDAEIDVLAANLKQIIDPDLVVMVEKDGEPIGFGLSLPDLNEPLLKAYPRPGVPEAWTMLKLLWYWKVRRRVRWLRVFALGVLPEYRGRGVDALMYLETARKAVQKGYEWAEMSWILENNVMMNRSIEMLGGEVYKTYRMYEKSL